MPGPNGEPTEDEVYAGLLPKGEALDVLLDQDVSELLRVGTADRALVDPGVDIVAEALASNPEMRDLLVTAQGLARRKRDGLALTDLTAGERRALDLFVFVTARPALYVREGGPGAAPPNWSQLGRATAEVRAVIAATGRLERPGHGHGTGFLVAPSLILTNNHVAWQLTRAEGDPPFNEWKQSYDLYQQRVIESNRVWSDVAHAVGFRPVAEAGRTGPTLPVRAVVASHRDADYALLELHAPSTVPPLKLERSKPAAVEGRKVYLVGFPGAPAENVPAAWVENVFLPQGGGHGVQRLSPGVLGRLLGPTDLRHDASTLGGSSGSPVVDLATHRVLGLHFAGSQGARYNQCIPLWAHLGDAELAALGQA